MYGAFGLGQREALHCSLQRVFKILLMAGEALFAQFVYPLARSLALCTSTGATGQFYRSSVVRIAIAPKRQFYISAATKNL
jgi:hypothetical protein